MGILIFISLIVCLLSIDFLFYYEFKEYSEEWKEDGEPCGLGWHKPGCSFFSACQFRRDAILRNWHNETPLWGVEDTYFVTILWLQRIATAYFFAFGFVALLKLPIFLAIIVFCSYLIYLMTKNKKDINAFKFNKL